MKKLILIEYLIRIAVVIPKKILKNKYTVEHLSLLGFHFIILDFLNAYRSVFFHDQENKCFLMVYLFLISFITVFKID